MRHRIFIAVNLPESVKKRLLEYQSRWPELPARWTKENNLHFTLAFLGYILDEELPEICKITEGVASRHSPFDVKLTKIMYGPPKKIPPRMIWAEGEGSEEFTLLRDDLEKSLSGSDQIRFSPENRAFSPRKGARPPRGFSPHITLARIQTFNWRRIEPEERPEVNENINISFEVSSIEVMESVLKRGGAEYTILESVPLSK